MSAEVEEALELCPAPTESMLVPMQDLASSLFFRKPLPQESEAVIRDTFEDFTNKSALMVTQVAAFMLMSVITNLGGLAVQEKIFNSPEYQERLSADPALFMKAIELNYKATEMKMKIVESTQKLLTTQKMANSDPLSRYGVQVVSLMAQQHIPGILKEDPMERRRVTEVYTLLSSFFNDGQTEKDGKKMYLGDVGPTPRPQRRVRTIQDEDDRKPRNSDGSLVHGPQSAGAGPVPGPGGRAPNGPPPLFPPA